MVYIEENMYPATIKWKESAIPCFIGYTERTGNGAALRYKPVRIVSYDEYESIFGGMPSVKVHLWLQKDYTLKVPPLVIQSPFLLPYAIQHYFQNGGGPCYVVSVGSFVKARISIDLQFRQMLQGLQAIAIAEEITLLVLPDAALLNGTEVYYSLLKEALNQCANRRNRFVILDVWQQPTDSIVNMRSLVAAFRSGIGNDHLRFGAAYFPWLRTTLIPFVYQEESSVLFVRGGSGIEKKTVLKSGDNRETSNSLYHTNKPLYNVVMQAVRECEIVLPPSAAVAGVYAKVDRESGVWKAPANVGLTGVVAPVLAINNNDNEWLNVDAVEGKSINAIRAFTGKGVLVWGARTLSGNDNEWRYVPVKRLFQMVEHSVQKGTEWVVFEPNHANTWVKVKALIENFLYQLWRQGALQGAKPEQAFYVAVGLGKTMTAQDILEGRLILQIGMAVVRPGEFIILRISHKMPTS